MGLLPEFDLESTPSDIVKIYFLVIYALSAIEGSKKLFLKGMMNKNEGTVKSPENYEKLEIVNQILPPTIYRNIKTHEKHTDEMFSHLQRYWTTRDGIRMTYDVVLDRHFPVTHAPVEYMNSMDTGNDFVKQLLKVAADSSKRLADMTTYEDTWKSEVATVVVVKLNYNSSEVKYDRRLEVISSNSDVTFDQVESYIKTLYQDDTRSFVKRKILFSLLKCREDLIMGDSKAHGYINRLLTNRIEDGPDVSSDLGENDEDSIFESIVQGIRGLEL